MLRTTNSKKVLSEDLQRVSVRVSAPTPNSSSSNDNHDSELTSGNATDGAFTAGDANVDWYEINGASGPSRATLWTSNSKVLVGFVGEEESVGKKESSCTFM